MRQQDIYKCLYGILAWAKRGLATEPSCQTQTLPLLLTLVGDIICDSYFLSSFFYLADVLMLPTLNCWTLVIIATFKKNFYKTWFLSNTWSGNALVCSGSITAQETWHKGPVNDNYIFICPHFIHCISCIFMFLSMSTFSTRHTYKILRFNSWGIQLKIIDWVWCVYNHPIWNIWILVLKAGLCITSGKSLDWLIH